MINKILIWAFSKSTLGRLIDGRKTEIGFSALAIRVLLAALTQIAGLGVEHFPTAELFQTAETWFSATENQFGKLLESFGGTLAGLGIWHDKVKRDNKNVIKAIDRAIAAEKVKEGKK